MSKALEIELPDLSEWDWGDAGEEFPAMQKVYEEACKIGAKIAIQSMLEDSMSILISVTDKEITLSVYYDDDFSGAIFSLSDEIIESAKKLMSGAERKTLAALLRKTAERIESLD